MELLTSILLGVSALIIGVGLLFYAIRGFRQSQARDSRTYRKGRL